MTDKEAGLQMRLHRGLKQVDHKNSAIGNCLADFDTLKLLGKGSYGTVYLVESKKEKERMVSSPKGYAHTSSSVFSLGKTNMASTKQSTSDFPNTAFAENQNAKKGSLR